MVRLGKKRISYKSHKLGIYKINEIYLPCFDDKRYILNDRNKTLPYGHKDICKLSFVKLSFVKLTVKLRQFMLVFYLIRTAT